MAEIAQVALQSALETWLAHETSSAVTVSGLAQMAGGASQAIWRFDLHIADGVWRGDYRLVARRQMGGKIYAEALDLAAEFEVLRAAYKSGVLAPRPYWFAPDVLGSATIVMARLDGETIGRRIVKAPEFAGARAILPEQMGAALAAIHQIDIEAHGLRASVPSSSLTPAQAHITRLEADLDRIGEPHPAIELCIRWLRHNEPPPPKKRVLVHGDYRLGNMMVTAEGLAGVLDWEFAHIGEAAEDIAWGMVREWRFGVDQLHFSGISAPEPFLAAYVAHGGEPIDVARLFYWEVMGNLDWAVGTLNQADRHLSGDAPNLEFASLGRRCAEIELEALSLIATALRGTEASHAR